MPMRRPRVSLAVLGLVLVATPLAAQTPIDESLSKRDERRLDNMEKVVREMRDIVFKARDSKAPVVVQPADTDARLEELAGKLSDLEHSLTRVNASLETAAHDVDQAKRDNAALQAQLKTATDRLTALEQKQAAAETAAAPPPATQAEAPAPKANAAESFTKARQLMLSGDYAAAEGAFHDYVQAYPDAPKTPEARYWWGKTLSVKGAHADAATAYIGAIRGWPQAVWAPDAVVELARELIALKKPTDACEALAELPKHYAKTAAPIAGRAAAARAQAKCG